MSNENTIRIIKGNVIVSSPGNIDNNYNTIPHDETHDYILLFVIYSALRVTFRLVLKYG